MLVWDLDLVKIASRNHRRSGIHTIGERTKVGGAGPEMHYSDVIEKVGTAIDAAGVAVIAVGALIAFVAAVTQVARREVDVYRRFRELLGRTILLGLELLVAGDIVRTVAAKPTLVSVAVLGAIVLIRTFLSFSLQVEVTGHWPWQRPTTSASRDDR